MTLSLQGWYYSMLFLRTPYILPSLLNVSHKHCYYIYVSNSLTSYVLESFEKPFPDALSQYPYPSTYTQKKLILCYCSRSMS